MYESGLLCYHERLLSCDVETELKEKFIVGGSACQSSLTLLWVANIGTLITARKRSLGQGNIF